MDRTNETDLRLIDSSTMNVSQDTTLNSIPYNTLTRNEQDMIVNVTREYPFNYATIMFGYIMPFVLVLTLVTNTLVVMVLAQKHMRTPTNIVLFTMAIVDLMTLLSPSPWYIYIYTLGFHDKFLYPPTACYAHHFMTDVIPVFFHTSSIWLALLLASQRYIYVCHPTLARTWCTVPRVRKAIIIILVTAFLHQLTRFFDNTFVSVYIKHDQGYDFACKYEISDWVHKLDIALYYTTYYTFRILFVFIIPCVALITLNCLLFRALRRAENKRTELLRTKFKLVDANQCSVTGLDVKRSSFANTDERPTNIESTSGLCMDQGRNYTEMLGSSNLHQLEISTHHVEGGPNKSRFFIASFRAKAKRNSGSCLVEKKSDQLDNSGRQLLDGNKYSFSTFDERGRRDSIESSNQDTILETELKGRDDSRDSCSVTTTHSKDIVCQSRLKRSRAHRQAMIGCNLPKQDSLKEDISCSKEIEGEYECAECAACERNQRLDYRRCSIATTEGATGDPLHHATSQCSSLIGGATNTTTNEDVSSCAPNQNVSSNMYMAHDGTLEAIEATSLREEDGLTDEIEQHRLSCSGRKYEFGAKETRLARIGACKLSRICSEDSRLTCGCSSALKDSVSGRNGEQRRRASHRNEFCTMSNCQSPLDGFVGSHVGECSNPKCAESSSKSDPCVDCNNGARMSARSRLEGKLAGLTSRFVYEPVNGNRDSNADLPLSAATARTTATTATTATTLFSATNNSLGSLLQVRGLAASKDKQREPQAQLKSPISLASTSGRGSAPAMMRGSNPPPVIISNTLGAGSSASIRTMDSNRTTLMLIVVVTVFLMVEVPVAIVTILHVVLNSFDVFRDVEFGSSLNYIKLFTNFFIMISYSVNFTIYCSMSKKFRETFRDLFLCGKRAKRKRAHRLLCQEQQQQQQHSQYNQHMLDPQDSHLGQSYQSSAVGQVAQNDLTTLGGGANQNTGLSRYFHCRKNSSQQRECEL